MLALLNKAIAPVMEPFAVSVQLGGSGADVDPMACEGVPGIGMEYAANHYFDVHHSQADILNKVDEDDFAFNVAAMRTFACTLAQSNLRFQ